MIAMIEKSMIISQKYDSQEEFGKIMSSLHAPRFSIRFDLVSVVLALEVVETKNDRFDGDGFQKRFEVRGTKMEMTPSCLPRRAGSKHVPVDLER